MKKFKNFYPSQYKRTNVLSINHNYLKYQFKDYKKILKKIEKVIIDGDFTLGNEVDNFEKNFAKLAGGKLSCWTQQWY